MRIVILNGPPNVGKDTLADKLIEDSDEDWFKFSFKDALYKETALYYGVDYQWFKAIASNRSTKEIKIAQLDFDSPREAMIRVSEKVIKPNYGKDFFGIAMLTALQQCPSIENVVIPDGGFEEETKVLMDAYPGQVWIVQMTASDCDFSNDSRNYIKGWPDQTFELAISRGYPFMDLEELYLILEDIDDITIANESLLEEPDHTPFTLEDFEGDRHYIGEENE